MLIVNLVKPDILILHRSERPVSDFNVTTMKPSTVTSKARSSAFCEESGNTFGRRPSHENENFTVIKFYFAFNKQMSNFKSYI